jgi:hypothetical protein
LYWIETDKDGVFLGPIEQQESLTGLPAARVLGPVGRRGLRQPTNLRPALVDCGKELLATETDADTVVSGTLVKGD